MIPSDYRTMDEAVRGEVTDRLDRMAEVRPLSYTPDQVQWLASRLIMPRTNGTFTGTSDPFELFRLADELGIVAPTVRAECPVSWCTANAYEHGGDGRTAAEYEHTSTADQLAPHGMLAGWFEQLADMPPFYRLESSTSPPDAHTLLSVSEVRALADEFERHAVTLRERAAQLEALGGIQ